MELAEANLKEGAQIYQLGENTISEDEWAFDFSFPEEGGDPNPHLWINVPYAIRYAELTAGWLSEHGAGYGLCQTYANETWHFELATTPGGECPAMRRDASS